MPYKDYILALNRGDLELAYEILKSNTSITPELKSHDYYYSGKPIIHLAVQQGNLDILRKLVESHRANINTEAPGGVTPLMVACELEQVEIVYYLLSSKSINVYQIDNHENNALHYAIKSGNLSITRILIEKYEICAGAVNDRGDNPLMIASQEGHLDIVEYLVLENKVSLHTSFNDGYHGSNCIILAIEAKHFSIVQFLIEERPILAHSTNKAEETILEISARVGDYIIFKYLYDKITEINKRIIVEKYSQILSNVISSEKISLVKFILGKGLEIFEQAFFYELATNALAIATQKGNLEILKLLIRKYGADVNKVSYEGLSLVVIAANSNHLHIVKYLMEQESRLDPIRLENVDKNLALLFASREGNIDIVNYLVKIAGVDPNYLDTDNAIITAVKSGKFEIVKFLVEECNVNIFAKNFHGEDVIDAALSLDNDMSPNLFIDFLVRKVIYKRSLISEESLNKALFFAVKKNNDALMKFLLEDLFLNHNAIDSYGNNIFKIALKNGNKHIVYYLLEKGYFTMEAVGAEELIYLAKMAIVEGNICIITNIASDTTISIEDKKILFNALIFDFLRKIPLDSNSFEAIKEIIASGFIDINNLVDFDRSILTISIIKNHVTLVQYLIENLSDVLAIEVKEEKNDPILLSIKQKRFEILKYLHNKVSEEYFKKQRENTNIYNLACKYGDLNMVKYFEEAVPEFVENTNNPDMTILLPVDFAVMEKNFPVLTYLCEKTEILPRVIMRIVLEFVENNRYGKILLSTFNSLTSSHYGITEFQDIEGNTPLIVAIKLNKFSIVSKLIEVGAEVEVMNIHNESPLTILLSSYIATHNPQDSEKIIEIVKDLVINRKVPIPADSHSNPIWKMRPEFGRIIEGFDAIASEDPDISLISFSSSDEVNPVVDSAYLEEMNKVWGEALEFEDISGW